MSRHSHWAKIKRAKGTEDAKRGATFTKLSRAITVATREKGGDLAMNFKLRLAIDAARGANMPKDTIDRAVARAAHVGEEGQLEEVTYEAIGPGGVFLIIEAVTDNRNRTSGNVKAILSRHGGALGASRWQFERNGVVRLGSNSLPQDHQAFELDLIDRGAEDVFDEEGGLSIHLNPERLQSVVEFLSSRKLTPEFSGIEWIPKTTVQVTDPATREHLDELYTALDADDDVSDYATNEA